MDSISWNDCQEWLQRLNRWLTSEWGSQGGQGDPPQLTLPGEGQWEAACRAGAATPFHFGDVLDAAWANFDGATLNAVTGELALSDVKLSWKSFAGAIRGGGK